MGCQIQIKGNEFRKDKYLTNYLCFTEHHIWIENIRSIYIFWKMHFSSSRNVMPGLMKPCLINQGAWVTYTISVRQTRQCEQTIRAATVTFPSRYIAMEGELKYQKLKKKTEFVNKMDRI